MLRTTSYVEKLSLEDVIEIPEYDHTYPPDRSSGPIQLQRLMELHFRGAASIMMTLFQLVSLPPTVQLQLQDGQRNYVNRTWENIASLYRYVKDHAAVLDSPISGLYIQAWPDSLVTRFGIAEVARDPVSCIVEQDHTSRDPRVNDAQALFTEVTRDLPVGSLTVLSLNMCDPASRFVAQDVLCILRGAPLLHQIQVGSLAVQPTLHAYTLAVCGAQPTLLHLEKLCVTEARLAEPMSYPAENGALGAGLDIWADSMGALVSFLSTRHSTLGLQLGLLSLDGSDYDGRMTEALIDHIRASVGNAVAVVDAVW
jgi:hypothetical protein